MSTIAIDARKLDDFGIGTYLRGLLRGLASLDRETSYVLLGDPSALARLELPANFSVRAERSPGYSLRELWSVARAVKGSGAGLLHVPHYVVPVALGCPLVVTVHDLIHLRFPEHRTPLETLYARIMIGRALRASRRVLAVSEATRRELLERFAARARDVAVVPNGVDERFRATLGEGEIDSVLERFGLARGYLLFVGNPKPHKNLELLLEAHARLRARRADAPRLVLIGCEPRPDRAPAICLGRLDEELLPALYRGASAVVVPSRWEGFGLPAAEAMASGTPVLATRAGALPEVVGEAGLLVEPDDAEAIAAAIERLLDEPGLAAELARRGRARADRYRWDETARLTLAHYRELLAAPSGRGT
ncbi:MAG TPA: glycosyltransferase family 1 protein [Thermoanaerobaculia bacterium]|nr:glycosyltransferase family 1 protein [Thermoanaerobaculia bacterium]